MNPLRFASVSLLFLSAFLVSSTALAQNRPPQNPPRGPPQNQVGVNVNAPPRTGQDPGVRPAPADAGGPLPGLDPYEMRLFAAAAARFREVSSVQGALPGEEGDGLGPRFNHNSCVGCHAFPAPGGTSPPRNPQVEVATLHGARNTIPPFITADGPVRVARFIRNADGSLDGGVHELFVVTGRSDAPGCNITQPNFTAALAANNVVFRIPTPMFGLGLVESTPDANLEAAVAAQATLRRELGITGRFNRSGNDGTIMRFGWKSQNKSLMVFAGEAYNVEQGVSNDVFPNERDTTPGCQFTASPEDTAPLVNTTHSESPASDYASDTVNFANLFRLSAAPTPEVPTAASTRGEQIFLNLGCQGCHVVAQTTGPSSTQALDRVNYRPYSDFQLHDMGQRLADGVNQGNANSRDWRTAPLWGLGQRIFFLHDGRTSDLVTAISAHASQGSEANTAIARFNQLVTQDVNDLLAFLRSL